MNALFSESTKMLSDDHSLHCSWSVYTISEVTTPTSLSLQKEYIMEIIFLAEIFEKKSDISYFFLKKYFSTISICLRLSVSSFRRLLKWQLSIFLQI
jgi:hypothetical protein